MKPQYIQSIASQSLGRAWHHGMDSKLAACARHGFKAVEIFMEDLEYLAQDLPKQLEARSPGTSFPGSTKWDEQRLAAADYIRQLCEQHELAIICLQPFTHYDGLIDRAEHEARILDLHFWIRLAQRIGTDLIQVPSSFLPQSQCTDDRDTIIADLQELADIGLSHSPPIRFAYEALCFGTHITRWDEAWEIVEAVDRPNFGTCLDTFNIAGRVFADPMSATGCTKHAQYDMARSLEKMQHKLNIDKVFYVEVCDGEKMDAPLTSSHEWYVADQPSRMTWSRNARLFPFEAKGYLPAIEILETIIDLGYEGYIAFELFSRTANMADESVPEDHARRGQQSWDKMMQHLQAREQRQSTSNHLAEASGSGSQQNQQSLARL